MTVEQRKALDKLLVEDAELVKELRSLGAGAEDGPAYLLTHEGERLGHLRAAILVERSRVKNQLRWGPPGPAPGPVLLRDADGKPTPEGILASQSSETATWRR